MLDIDMEEKLVEKVGGKFKLSILIQKRMIELVQGSKPLVDVEVEGNNNSSTAPNRHDLVKIIMHEIMADKISLAPAEEVQQGLLEEMGAKKSKETTAKDLFDDELKKMKKERIEEMSSLFKVDQD